MYLSARYRELHSIHREIYAQPTYHPHTSNHWRFLHCLGAKLLPGRLSSLGDGAITTCFSWTPRPERSITIKSSNATASVRPSGFPERLNAKTRCTKTDVNVALVLPMSASCQHHILRCHLPRKPWKSWWPITNCPFLSNRWAFYKHSSPGSWQRSSPCWRQAQQLTIKSFWPISPYRKYLCMNVWKGLHSDSRRKPWNSSPHGDESTHSQVTALATCLKAIDWWGRFSGLFLSIQCDLHNTLLLEMLQHPSLLLIVVLTLTISISIEQTRKPCLLNGRSLRF